jgi:hypothetical protein
LQAKLLNDLGNIWENSVWAVLAVAIGTGGIKRTRGKITTGLTCAIFTGKGYSKPGIILLAGAGEKGKQEA